MNAHEYWVSVISRPHQPSQHLEHINELEKATDKELSELGISHFGTSDYEDGEEINKQFYHANEPRRMLEKMREIASESISRGVENILFFAYRPEVSNPENITEV